MENIKRYIHIYREKYLYRISIFSLTYIFFYLLYKTQFSEPVFLHDATAILFKVALWGLAPVVLLFIFEERHFETWLLFLNMCHLLISRSIIGGIGSVFSDKELRYSFIFFVIFAIFFYLRKEERERLVRIVITELLIIFLIWGSVGVITSLSGTSLPGFSGIRLRSEQAASLVYIKFYSFHRNTSSVFFVAAALLVLYQYQKRKTVFWKISSWAMMTVSYMAVAFQHSRTNYLSFAFALAILLMLYLSDELYVLESPKEKKAGILIIAIMTVLLYMSFSSFSNTAMKLSSSFRSEDLNVIKDSRSTISDATSLTGRTDIWKAGITAIKKDPSIALFGLPAITMMDAVNIHLQVQVPHMHNMFFQHLMAAGIPGLLLYLLFVISLIVKAIRVYIRYDGTQKPKELTALYALLGAMLLHGIMGPLLSYIHEYDSLLFIFAASVFIIEYKESRPVPERPTVYITYINFNDKGR